MVKIKQKFSYREDGSLDTSAWLEKLEHQYPPNAFEVIKKTVSLTESASKGLTTFYGQPCLEQGLEMGEIIANLNLDHDAVATAILTSSIQHSQIKSESITVQVSDDVAKLIHGVSQLNILNTLNQASQTKSQTQIDRLRKAFLAMASDIRVILIKLAERTSIMRGIKNINFNERRRLAQDTMDIYAPLANRLGIGSLKWELEDLAFHYINPEMYKKIASFLAERRTERQERIQNILSKLSDSLKKMNIQPKVSGRAKHIYSIFLKMQKKHLDLNDIFDYSAVRILVPTLQDCYTALSIAHQLWEHLPEEFDDYISNPKPNGYRSIHTAVVDEDGKHFEIQIRTISMHEEAEHGVAAHWIYKESKPQQTGYEAKITLLRHLLAWHKDVSKTDSTPEQPLERILEDNVYVFTPVGDIMELEMGATPLDFAYHIHSEVGHRCRGAKINGHIVPLTYQLKTSDRVEIITIQNGTPSRDWIRKDSHYIKTSRARAKISQWFKLQDQDEYYEAGKQILERELTRSTSQPIQLSQVATRLKFKDEQSMLIALGRGTLRMAHILHASDIKSIPPSQPTQQIKKSNTQQRGFQVGNTQDLLTRIALCCKPIPGDEIIGYITQGRGVSIHKKSCSNITFAQHNNERRLVDVNWDDKHCGGYYADLQIRAYGKEQIIKEITSLLANSKIDLVMLNSTINKANNLTIIVMTIQINNVLQLTQLTEQIKHLSHIIDVKRINR